MKTNNGNMLYRLGAMFIVMFATMSLMVGGVQALGSSISGQNLASLLPGQNVNMNFTIVDFSDLDTAAGTSFDVKVVRVVCVTSNCNPADISVVLGANTVSAANPTVPLTISMSANPSSANMSAYTIELSAGPSGSLQQNTNSTKSFRLTLPSVSGYKFEDKNGNGLWDAGEPGLSGWTVQLQLKNGTVVNTVTTQADGSYKFTGVYPGNYTVAEVLQSGWKQTAFVGVFQVRTYDITGKNIGNFKLGTISGMKFNDMNGNGVKDAGDNGLSGWTINLTGTDTITGTPVNLSTVTGTNGDFSFTGLGNGAYTLSEVQQNGWVNTLAPASVNIASGTISTGNNFGNFKLGSISGMKFNDMNGNGVKDAGDNGLSGWTINLTGTDTITGTHVNLSTVTGTNGDFSFTGLGNGAYMLSEVQQNGWVNTLAPASVNIASGTISTGNNFGNQKVGCPVSVSAGTIAVCKYFDANRNGIRDSGEQPMAGITFDLLGPVGGSSIRLSAITNSAGVALFEGLVPGRYMISERMSSIPQNMKITQGAGGYIVPGGTVVWFGNACSPSNPNCWK